MKALFDTSSIFRAIKENQVECLIGNSTLELARYELGNVLWKNYFLHKKATDHETRSLTKIVKDALSLMVIEQIGCTEEKILEIAARLRISFYDASYVYHAKAKKYALVTEDQQLAGKVESFIEANSLDGWL